MNLNKGRLVRGLICFGLGIGWAAPTVAQDDEPETIDQSISEPVQNGAIPYDPFAMVDPETGEEISPDTILTIGGTSLRAGEY